MGKSEPIRLIPLVPRINAETLRIWVCSWQLPAVRRAKTRSQRRGPSLSGGCWVPHVGERDLQPPHTALRHGKLRDGSSSGATIPSRLFREQRSLQFPSINSCGRWFLFLSFVIGCGKAPGAAGCRFSATARFRQGSWRSRV